MLNHTQELILNHINAVQSCSDLVKIMGKGYTPEKVQSMVCTLARKGHINPDRAAHLLKDSPEAKFLGIPFGSKLKKV